MTKLYIILPYYDHEGFGAPLKAYYDMEKASIMEDEMNNWLKSRPPVPDLDEDWGQYEAEYVSWTESCPIKAEYPPSFADKFTYVAVEVE